MPKSCPIGWQPSVLAPVFYGVRDYGPSGGVVLPELGQTGPRIEEERTRAGAPSPVRVFFPSLEGAVFSAPILKGCGRYPLILFLHGHCSEPEHYKKWFELAAQLARSGYVVAVPELPETAAGTRPWTEPHPDLQRLHDVSTWIREDWEHRATVLPVPATGVIGHSFGALLGARFAAEAPVSAYASLSGVWQDWPVRQPRRPIDTLAIPMLYTWGTGGNEVAFADLDQIRLWDIIATPKHKAVFADANHWDYLRAGRTTCEEEPRGPCNLVEALARDIVSMFFGKYLPPELWPGLGDRLPNSLVPPSLTRTPAQRFYAGDWLPSMRRIRGHPECRTTLSWETATGKIGSITRP